MITELFVVLIVCSIANFQDMLSCFQLFMIESPSVEIRYVLLTKSSRVLKDYWKRRVFNYVNEYQVNISIESPMYTDSSHKWLNLPSQNSCTARPWATRPQ